MTRRGKVLLTLAAFVVVAAGCSGSGSEKSSSTGHAPDSSAHGQQANATGENLWGIPAVMPKAVKQGRLASSWSRPYTRPIAYADQFSSVHTMVDRKHVFLITDNQIEALNLKNGEPAWSIETDDRNNETEDDSSKYVFTPIEIDDTLLLAGTAGYSGATIGDRSVPSDSVFVARASAATGAIKSIAVGPQIRHQSIGSESLVPVAASKSSIIFASRSPSESRQGSDLSTDGIAVTYSWSDHAITARREAGKLVAFDSDGVVPYSVYASDSLSSDSPKVWLGTLKDTSGADPSPSGAPLTSRWTRVGPSLHGKHTFTFRGQEAVEVLFCDTATCAVSFPAGVYVASSTNLHKNGSRAANGESDAGWILAGADTWLARNGRSLRALGADGNQIWSATHAFGPLTSVVHQAEVAGRFFTYGDRLRARSVKTGKLMRAKLPKGNFEDVGLDRDGAVVGIRPHGGVLIYQDGATLSSGSRSDFDDVGALRVPSSNRIVLVELDHDSASGRISMLVPVDRDGRDAASESATSSSTPDRAGAPTRQASSPTRVAEDRSSPPRPEKLRRSEPAVAKNIFFPGSYPARAEPSKASLSGDGSDFLKNLSWKSWTSIEAVGFGLESLEHCDESCETRMDATVIDYPVRIRASKPEHLRCGTFFSRIDIYYQDAVPSHRSAQHVFNVDPSSNGFELYTFGSCPS